MSFAADRILELLEEEGPMSPGKIEEDDRIRFGRTHTNNVLIQLEKAGLVRKVGNGVHSIEGKGVGYLNGTEDLRDLEEPD